MKNGKIVLGLLIWIFGTFAAWANPIGATRSDMPRPWVILRDTAPGIEERYGDFVTDPNRNSFDLRDPNIIDRSVEYDPVSDQYIIYERIGDDNFRTPTYMSFDEYNNWRAKRQQDNYFKELAGISSSEKSGADKVDPITKVDLSKSQDSRVKALLEKSSTGKLDPLVKMDLGSKLLDRLFGGTKVDIRPQGNIDLTFGGDWQKQDNPNIPPRARRQGGFDFDMNIQMNVTGQIGEKLKLNANYNTKATFDFENIMKLNYNSSEFSEDDIVKSIEAGNVSLPLRGQLIQGAQSLFGIKTELQFGYLRLTAIASQQKSQRQEIQVQGGSQIQNFSISADQYDENRHFFLSHYNRGVFEQSVANLPQINSQFHIENLEVWVTNEKNETQNIRDILALADLGEYDNITSSNVHITPGIPHPDIFNTRELPSNSSNDLYHELRSNPQARYADKVVSILQSAPFSFQQGKDFEVVRARKLSSSEYTYNADLGTISVNINLRPDQVLAASYEYTYRGQSKAANGDQYKIGELTADFDRDSLKIIVTKLLKSTTPRVDIPMWDLMMKNVYNIGAYQSNREDFRLDIYYEDPGGGQKRFLPTNGLNEIPLLRFFNLDNLNIQGDPQPDGQFDYVPPITVNQQTGRIMFPLLEPFGSSLAKKIIEKTNSPAVAAKYTYQQLYDSTLFRAQEYQEFNRFTIKGTYKSSVSSEISLGTFNLPQGSVRVTAGGQLLTEGADYDIDYNTGKLKILNDAILQQGAPIKISFEDNTLFGFQTKTLLGVRADYKLKKDFNIGATFMNLFERPFTQKVNIGDDPINNKIYGLDLNYSKEVPVITRLLDRLPLIQTKEPSQLTVSAEGAYIQPGHSKAINQGGSKGGSVYIDDFEGSVSPLSLITTSNNWVLASVPQNDNQNSNPLFPESAFIDSTISGVNRARMSWRIDFDDRAKNDEDRNDPYSKTILRKDIFPNQYIEPGQINTLRPFDVTYYPDERGPYNFDIPGGYAGYSSGLRNNGGLKDPETRWAGIMRSLQYSDFESSNVEFIEFWMLDPFINDPDNPGKLCINLGNISEDILRDSRQFYENGLPAPGEQANTKDTKWGRIPLNPPVVNAFDNGSNETRASQDVGLDGLTDEEERGKFDFYINACQLGGLLPEAMDSIRADPSNDNFVSYTSDVYPGTVHLADRYRKFSNPQGNTPILDNSTDTRSSTQLPDSEDLNNDKTLNQTESYYQYEIPLTSNDDGKGIKRSATDYITDTLYGSNTGGTWYRFKIPIDQFTTKVGGIQDFRSIRFIRIYMKGFKKETTLRFATLDLVRNQWRRYRRSLDAPGGLDPGIAEPPSLDVTAVNIEENSGKIPFHYTLPPGIDREPTLSAFPGGRQNEQSIAMNVCGLGPKEGTGIFKVLGLDLRQYERLKMFVHAESHDETQIDSGKVAVFMRIGSDFENNYYEYEVPVTMSDTAVINGIYNANDSRYVNEIWKKSNEFDFPLSLLTDVKEERNRLNIPLNFFHEKKDPENTKNTVRVKGNPNLGLVKGVLIGIRNYDSHDHCVEVWANELRLNGLDEHGGGAALARVDLKMADVGQVTLSGGFTSIGFGGLDKRLADRSRDNIYEYGLVTQVELGKLLPEKTGIKVPFYYQYTGQVKTPQYDPYDLDIKLDRKLSNEPNSAARDSIRKAAQTVTTIKSLNFTNVRKERTDRQATPMPWDIENFSASYAFTETKRHDPIIENGDDKLYKGGIDYNYTRTATFIQPLKKLIKKDKYLKFLSDFNFNPLPNGFGFNTQMERNFALTKYRFAGEDPQYNTYFIKRFTWDRNYELQWDLAKSLKLNFNAINRSVIDEPAEFTEDGHRITNQVRNDSIWTNIRSFGRTKNYNHILNVDYTLPMKSIFFLDWTKITARFEAKYSWDAAALNADSLGNIIQNGQTRSINGDFNFESLYNKMAYLKKINTPAKSKGGDKSGKGGKGKGGNDTKNGGEDEDAAPGGKDQGPGAPPAGGKGDKGDKGNVDRLADGPPGLKNQPQNNQKQKRNDTQNPTDQKNNGPVLNSSGVDDANPAGSKVGPDGKPLPANPVAGPDGKPGADGAAGAGPDGKVKKKAQPKDAEPSTIERVLIRPLMSLRSVKLRYQEVLGSVVPGYTPKSKSFGMDNFKSPGLEYIAGFHPDQQWLDNAGEQGWLTQNQFFNQQTIRRYSQDFNANATIEPFSDFKVELEATKKYTKDHSEYFLYDQTSGAFLHNVPRDMGSYTITYSALNTLFKDNVSDLRKLFKEFEDNRVIISQRLGVNEPPHPDNPNYKDGYGKTNQNVLIPAFLAAYTGKNAQTVNTNVFKETPRLNWRFTYNGLSKLPFFRDVLQSVSITHGYKSTLTVNSYNTSLYYDPNNTQLKNPANGDYYSQYQIPTMVINEQFAPLLGVDLRFKNDMSIKVDFKKGRMLSTAFADYSLNETKTTEYVVNFAYRVKDVRIPFLTNLINPTAKKKKKTTDDTADKQDAAGGKKDKSNDKAANDLKFNFDFSYRDDVTFLHQIDQLDAEPTRGTTTIQISPAVEYQLSKRLSLRLFFDYYQTIPKTSISFNTTNIKGGLTVRFSLN